MGGQEHPVVARRYSRRAVLHGGARGAVTVGLFGGFASLAAACGPSVEVADPEGGAGGDGSEGGGLTSALYLAEDVPPGLDWDGPSAAIPIAQFGMEQFYGTLVTYEFEENEDGVLVPNFDRLRGELAESWESDGLAWTFKLREGVRSCHGNELTTDDVIWTFERAKSVSGAAPVAWFLLNVSSVMTADPLAPDATEEDKAIAGEIEKVDDYRFTVNQFAPNLLFPLVLAVFALPIVDSTEAKKHATDEDPWAHEWINTQGAAGFGPYCLKEWTKGQEMVFETNEGWPGGDELVSPTLTTVTLRKVPSASTRSESLETGAAQIATGLTSRNFEELRESGGSAKVLSVLGNENTFLHMNFQVPPWDNVALRQAIAYAMPYEGIIEAAYFGQAEKWNGVVPPTYPGYHEVATYETDVDRARELLAEAGFPEGQGLDAFGEALNLFYVAEKQDQIQPIALQIQTALRDIGVEIELAPIPQSQYGDRQLVKRDLPLAINDQEKPIVPDAGYAVQLFFISPENGGLNNMVNYSNEEVDRLWLDQAKNEQDPERRNAVLAEIQEILMREVAWLPIVVWRTQVALNEQLGGYAWDPGNAVQLKYLTAGS